MKHTSSTPIHKLHLYQFKGFDMGEFISKYLYILNPHEVIVEVSTFKQAETKMTEKKRGTQKADIIENKCRYLQDAIIRRAYSRFDTTTTFTLSSVVLKAVIGAEYKIMLDVLIEMGYIILGNGIGEGRWRLYYHPFVYSMHYTLNDVEIEQITITNLKIQTYKEETLRQIKKQTKNAATGFVDDAFLNTYRKSLKYIRIADYDGLRNYIKTRMEDKPDAGIYYDFLIKELEQKDKRIYRIDYSHRFYHVLTNLKKELKQYLSIDFELDCKNSHPVLFNYFIFQRHNIFPNSSYQICKYLVDLYKTLNNKELDSISNTLPGINQIPNNSPLENIHNVVENFRNSLEYSDIAKGDFASLKPDEIRYIYKTCNGVIWDEICERHPDLDRSEVKQAMFGAVFYTRKTDSDMWSEYAREFKKEFPHVFGVIGEWKRDDKQDMVKEYMETHHLPYNDTASLPVAMMALEAEIFTTILRRLYARRWNAVHIHDCIVIPQDGNANHPTKEQVLQIMRDVYREYGLYPTFD